MVSEASTGNAMLSPDPPLPESEPPPKHAADDVCAVREPKTAPRTFVSSERGQRI
jgi:hypothetical protein